jgi:hypothetical protein
MNTTEQTNMLSPAFINPVVFQCREEDYRVIAEHIRNLRLLIGYAERMASEVEDKRKLYTAELSAFLETF